MSAFSNPPGDYAPAEATNSPYAKQLAALEERSRHERTQAQWWRRCAFAISGLACLAVAGLVIVAATKPPPSVHLVEIDQKTGEPLKHQILGEPVTASDAMVSHALGRWLQWTRGKSIDPIVIRQNWEQAYHFVPASAKPRIDAYAKEIKPFDPDTLRKEAITVEISSIVRQSKDTFQARWIETAFRNGAQSRQKKLTANIGVSFLNPSTPRQIQTNPMGIMIDQIFIEPDYVTAAGR